MAVWRLIVDGAADGATNMAVDEALLEGAARGGPPTLRLYFWDPPCVSLGYFQPLSDVDMVACREAGVTLVRRSTGGRAVLHADEVTYAVVGALGRPPFTGGVTESYERIAQGLLAGLAELGVGAQHAAPLPAPQRRPARSARGPACFEVAAPHEITVDGRKLVGSAQTRRSGAVLQHGAVALGGDPARIGDLLAATPEQRPGLRARLAACSTTLSGVLGRPVAGPEAALALARGFSLAFGLRMVAGELAPDERALAERLRAERYANPAWQQRR